MLLRDATWNKIRTAFSEEEKKELRTAITGETICPRGNSLDTSKLSIELRDKLGKELLKVM